MRLTHIGIFLFLVLLVSACAVKKMKVVAEDYVTFYDRFHSDADFQKERLAAPIKGYFIENGQKISWTVDNWQLHKQKLDGMNSKEYKLTIEKSADRVVEKLVLPDSHFYFERTFLLIKGRWYLISCIDQS